VRVIASHATTGECWGGWKRECGKSEQQYNSFHFPTPCLRLFTDETALQITEIDRLKLMQLLDDELTTAGGIMPVTRIDGNAVTDGMPGSVTQRLTALYWEKHGDPDWSTAID